MICGVCSNQLHEGEVYTVMEGFDFPCHPECYMPQVNCVNCGNPVEVDVDDLQEVVACESCYESLVVSNQL